MFKKKIILLLFIIPFVFACERLKEPKKDETAEVGAKQSDTADLITLKPEAIKEADIKSEAVSLMPLKTEHTFSGRVDVNETKLAHVGSRIPGRAVDVYINIGDYVKKGEPLTVIDSPELGEAQSHYLKTKSNLQVAERSYERAKTLLEGKVISTGEFQRREAEYHSAKAEAKAAEDRLHLFGMTDEDIFPIGKAHTIDSRVAIKSPIAGTVIERHLTIGEVVEPVKPLFVIADLSRLWVIADIPEIDIPKIKKGQAVAVTVSPYPASIFRGEINYISEVIDPETMTVKVRAEVENKNKMLKPGMFAAIKISTGEKDVLAIPVSAVQREGENTILFIATPPSLPFTKGGDEGVFEKRVVELGPPLNGFHEVISGVKEGERVVTKGAFTLKSEGLKGLMEGE